MNGHVCLVGYAVLNPAVKIIFGCCYYHFIMQFGKAFYTISIIFIRMTGVKVY